MTNAAVKYDNKGKQGEGMRSGKWLWYLGAFGVLSVTLFGCGGGGGGSAGGGVSLVVNPPTLSAQYATAGQAVSQPAANLVITPSSPLVGAIYVLATADAQVLAPGAYSAGAGPNGTLYLSLPFNPNLSPGTYTGNITLRFCRDPACATEIAVTGARIPYVVTVNPAIQISVFVNGTLATSQPIQIVSGDVLALQSTTPVSWSQISGGANRTNEVSTSTTWSATIVYATSPPGGPASFSVIASDIANQAQVTTSVSVLP